MSSISTLLLVGFLDPFFCEVVRKLKERNQKLVVLSDKESLPIFSTMPGLELIQYDYLYRLETVGKAFPLSDKAILDSSEYLYFSECKSGFLRILDRIFLVPKTNLYNDNYFRELLAYWIGYLRNREDINKIIFHCVPHFPAEFVLFYAAKFLGRETIILRRTSITDYMVLDHDFRPNYSSLLDLSSTGVSSDDDLLFISSEKESYATTYSKAMVGRRFALQGENPFKAKYYSLNSPFELFKAILSTIKQPLKVVKYWISPDNLYFQHSSLRMLLFRVRRSVRRIRALQWLFLNTNPVDFSESFIYYALHYRPERTTIPEASEYYDQASALKLLSSALLETSIKIVIKEHPRQLDDFLYPDLRRMNFPEVELYKELSTLPNVTIAPLSTSSNELIDKCICTASCTGTTVWEGLQTSKPGITFGPTWHSSCISTPIVQSKSGIQKAIHRLTLKSPESVFNDRSDFLKTLSNYSFISSFSFLAAQASSYSFDFLTTNLAVAIINCRENHNNFLANQIEQ